jgi:hypothetical protein
VGMPGEQVMPATVIGGEARRAGFVAWREAWGQRQDAARCYAAVLAALAPHVERRIQQAYADGVVDGRDAEREDAHGRHSLSIAAGSLGYVLTKGRWHLSCASAKCPWSVTAQRRTDAIRQYQRHAGAEPQRFGWTEAAS